jgi:branched-chain amino acid transport system substrate-binding protein
VFRDKNREEDMKKRIAVIGLVALLLVVALMAMACGGEKETTTTAAPSTVTTAAPSTETTAAPSTETTVATGPATGTPIKVGFSNSLTGPSAAPGVSVSKGANLQVEYINANGGINGRPIELIEIDDKSDNAQAQANVTKLIEEDKVLATIGPFAQFNQARTLAEETQTPTVFPGPATLADLKGPSYKWSVMVSAGPPVQADATGKVIKANGWKNILAIADVLEIHQETLDVLVEAAPAGGFTFTKMPDTFGFDVTDFQPILNRIMEEYKKLKPDAVLIYVNPIAAPGLYKGLRTLGVTVPILGSPAAAHPAIFSMGPEAVEGFLVLDSGGIVNPAGLPDTWPVKELQLGFVQRYTEKYKEAPDFFSAVGADMVSILAEAMKQAGGADDKQKVAEALVNLKEFKTLEGIVNYTPEDTTMGIKGNMVEFQVKNAVFEFVNTIN